MPYKSILIPLDGSDSCCVALAYADNVARRMSAHLNILHVQADTKEAVPLLGEGMSGAMIEEMIDLADRDAAERALAAHSCYETFCQNNHVAVSQSPVGNDSVTVAWRQEVGREDEMVANFGRVSDLIVIAQPLGEAERPSLMTLHAAIFETGKPVLLVPPRLPDTVGQNVMISWNGTAEAARAIEGALPLLRLAEKVVAVSVETEKARSHVTGKELAAHLSWHGIQAEVKGISPSTRTVGDVVMAECERENADLLIMGAYTHSRLIQIILGGVTRQVIAETKIPVLLAQ